MSEPVYMHYDDGSAAAHLWRARGPASVWQADGLRAAITEPLPRIGILLIGDGRDKLRDATVQSFLDEVYGYQLGAVVQIDDRRHDLGFGGAIRTGWHYLRQLEVDAQEFGRLRPFDYVFHLEEDWRFLEPIDVRWLVSILDGADRGRGAEPPVIRNPEEFPRIAQAALKRGPVNAVERAAGGLVELWPRDYIDAGVITPDGATPYLQHRLFFTTNPSLYRSELMMLGWPDCARSEAEFTRELLGWGYAFAFYGSRQSPPSVEHTGTQRTGVGY